MSDAFRDVVDKARSRGLSLLSCACCAGKRLMHPGRGSKVNAEWMHRLVATDGPAGAYLCPACDGTGEDRTPGGVLMAVMLGDVNFSKTPVSMVTFKVCGDDIERAGVVQVSHDGTPESIATAALKAFCRAREATP